MPKKKAGTGGSGSAGGEKTPERPPLREEEKPFAADRAREGIEATREPLSPFFDQENRKHNPSTH